jgi:hypothetical protein
LKKTLKILAAVLFVLILFLSGVVYYFYTNIKPILVTEINKALAVEVNVGDISISGIRDFPNLGVKFTNVTINESTPFYQKKLLEAAELSLFVDIIRLYKGEYVIDGIVLRGGQLYVADFINGNNYDIIKPSTDSSNTTLSFEIKSLKLYDCKIRYEHTPSRFKMNGFTPYSQIGLKYKDENTFLSIKTQLESTLVSLEGNKYVNKQNLSINTALTINTLKEFVVIDPSNIKIQEVKLSTRGKVSYGKLSDIDIAFTNENTTTQSLLSILPSSITESMSNLQLKGEVILDGSIKGKTYGRNQPGFEVSFDIKNTDLTVIDKNISLNGIIAKGNVKIPNISQLNSASAACKLSYASSGNNQLSGDITVSDFDTPHITWDGEANLDAAFLFALANNTNFETTNGRVQVAGQFGLVYDAAHEVLLENSLTYNGSVILEKLSGTLQNPEIKLNNLNLNLSANNQKMVINSLDFDYNKTTGNLKGIIENYTSLLDENTSAQIVGDLSVTNLNVNELFTTSATESEEQSTSSAFLIPVNCELKTDFTNFVYNDFHAESMTGTLLSDRTSISMPNVYIKALEGTTTAAIKVKKWGENHLLDIQADLSSINITQLFKQFNNFEQSEITDKHLSGTLSGKIIAKVILDKQFEPILPKLYAKADIIIENGALINYEPLRQLSKFVNIKELEKVRFKTLKNTIEIFDETIYIPRMMIENSALNLELEGTHTFGNYMRYSIGLSVAELLATKANWIAKKAEKRIENNSKGGLTAYIIMEGTPDDLKIRYDKATVKENVKEEVKKEKQNFLRALKGEGTLETNVEIKDYDNVWDE